MLKIADTGIAVANAIPVVRQSADQVIGANTDDAVVAYIGGLIESGVDAPVDLEV